MYVFPFVSPLRFLFLLLFSSQAVVATIMLLSQWQSQCNGHDHDMTTEWHKQPPRACMRSFSHRPDAFFSRLQVSLCDLPVPAGFLLLRRVHHGDNTANNLGLKWCM
ncbi:hypothetical protein F5148DRAFT_1271096 [Russula earlei]|uniref:Uncharacterized protein n=1 Tax=Russula earlei TaxID=71964 RepID=A0ACC0TR95_9AGAM|nr:hypothetical protein F5148DRAFT_1271096 [Russula earlei]